MRKKKKNKLSNAQDFLSSLKIKNKRKKKVPKFRVSSHPPPNVQPTRTFESFDSVVPQNPPPKPDSFDTSTLKDVKNFGFPTTNFEAIQGHGAPVTCIDSDLKGARFVSGGMDFHVKLWEFHSAAYPMTFFGQPLNESGGPIMGFNPINQIKYDHRGRNILVAANSSQLKILNANAKFLAETIQGDMYLQDKSKTKGHLGAIFDCRWHPLYKESFLTCSVDGTMRLWDAEKCSGGNFRIVKCLGAQKRRFPCTSCTFNLDGSLFIGAVDDGSLHMFPLNSNSRSSVAETVISGSHAPKSHVSRLRTSPCGNYLIQRGGADSSLKVWDLRKMQDKTPLKSFTGLSNAYDQTNIEFSPDGQYFFTATSKDVTPTSHASIFVFDLLSLECISEWKILENTYVIGIHWNKALNQIFCGCADNSVKIFYDPEISKKGILYPLEKKKRPKHLEDMQAPEEIFNPHALRMFQKRDTRSTRWAKNRRDPKKTFQPEKPQRSGVGSGGAIGTCETEGFLAKMGLMKKPEFFKKDPREDLWKVAEEAAKNPQFIDVAYKNQPKVLKGIPDTNEQNIPIAQRNVPPVIEEKKKRERDNDDNDEEDRFSKRRKME